MREADGGCAVEKLPLLISKGAGKLGGHGRRSFGLHQDNWVGGGHGGIPASSRRANVTSWPLVVGSSRVVQGKETFRRQKFWIMAILDVNDKHRQNADVPQI